MDGTGTPRRSAAFERRLPPQPASVREARKLLRELLETSGRTDLIDNGVLLTSEVVTNALLHAGTDMELIASAGPEGLRVEVVDGSAHLPVRRRYAATSGTGRGLMLLDLLVDDWGAEPRGAGKAVWFRLEDGSRSLDVIDPEGRQSVDTVAADPVRIRLLHMPLLMHSAWREHTEALLREYLLASLDDTDDIADPIQVHAEATDAIALLEEQVPAAAVDLDPHRIMAEAVEPAVSHAELEIVVPRSSVRNFVTLDTTIERALELVGAGIVLTPPTQPEVKAFRRWLCHQVVSQAAGAEPVAWSLPVEAAEHTPVGPDWGVEDVVRAPDIRIAADETNRILAVSPAAVTMLGYDDPEQLVGGRLVAIVPERFRQAHVSGLTLHLLVGRQPLVGRPVDVPMLRRDGSEVDVQLMVTARRDRRNRRVFVAEITPGER